MNKNIYFWIHLFVLVLAYTSPLLIDWRLIILGVMALQIQYWAINGCVLTKLEMGHDKSQTFLWYHLQKIFPGLNTAKTKFVVRIIIPLILILISFIAQFIYGFKPWLIHF